jgi:hypothetical protein
VKRGGDLGFRFWFEQDEAIYDYEYRMLCSQAYHGSIDAAKALHDAVLPGFKWKLSRSNATAYPFNAPSTGSGFYGMAENPARAWLIAILEALIAMEE